MRPAPKPEAKGTREAAERVLESLVNGEQGADCATAGVPPLRIGSFSLSFHANSRALFDESLFHTPLFHPIIRRFFRDDDVMYVALTQSSGGDSHESTLFPEFLKRRRPHVSHAAFEPPDQLIRQRAKRTLVGHAAFHAFRDGLGALSVILHQSVTVGARFHCAGRTHPSIRLKRAALIENGLSRRLFRAGKKAADHHA